MSLDVLLKMKILLVTLTAIILSSCSKKSDSDFQEGFIEDDGVEYVSDKKNHLLYHLDLEPGERKTISIGVAFKNRGASGMSSSGATIERSEDELRLISGGGGSKIKWQQKQGDVIKCSRSIESEYVNETYTFEFRIKDKTETDPAQ